MLLSSCLLANSQPFVAVQKGMPLLQNFPIIITISQKIVMDFVGLTFTILLKHETLDMNRGKNCMMLHCQHRISTLLVVDLPL